MRPSLAFAAAEAVCSLSGGARAAGVELTVILAADVSRSVDDTEFELQRKGYAAALTDPRVQKAIRATKSKAIGVCFIEWSGEEDQQVVLPWTEIRDEEDGGGAAAAILKAPRSFTGRTSISAAIDYAMKYFAQAKWPATRRVIDFQATAPVIQAARSPRRAIKRSLTGSRSTGWRSSTISPIWDIPRTPTPRAGCPIITSKMLLADPTHSWSSSRISTHSPTRWPTSWQRRSTSPAAEINSLLQVRASSCPSCRADGTCPSRFAKSRSACYTRRTPSTRQKRRSHSNRTSGTPYLATASLTPLDRHQLC